MAKIIYYIKIILFRSKFELNETGLLNLGHFTLFIMRLYLKVWYTSNDTSGAPFNDLNFLKDPIKYKYLSNDIYTN